MPHIFIDDPVEGTEAAHTVLDPNFTALGHYDLEALERNPQTLGAIPPAVNYTVQCNLLRDGADPNSAIQSVPATVYPPLKRWKAIFSAIAGDSLVDLTLQ